MSAVPAGHMIRLTARFLSPVWFVMSYVLLSFVVVPVE